MVVFKSRSKSDHHRQFFDVSTTGSSPLPRRVLHLVPEGNWMRNVRRFFLAFCWLAGLVCGVIFAFSAGPYFISAMRGLPLLSVSIDRLISVTMFPFFFSALAVLLSLPKLLYLLAFLESFLLAAVGIWIRCSDPDAGWLMHWLLCFSSCLRAPVLLCYWSRRLDGRRSPWFCEVALLASAGSGLGSLDYFITVPLLTRLIHS